MGERIVPPIYNYKNNIYSYIYMPPRWPTMNTFTKGYYASKILQKLIKGATGGSRKRGFKGRGRSKQRSKLKAQIGRLPGVGLPDSLVMKFKFAQAFNLTNTTNDVSSIQVGTNNPIDPLGSASSIQPRYWDQLVGTTLYDRTLVRQCHYKVTMINHADTVAMIQIAFRDQDYSLPNNAGAMEGDAEFINTQTFYLPVSGSGKEEKIVSGRINPYAILGISKSRYWTDLAYSGTSSSPPDLLAFMYVITASLPTKPTGHDTTILVEITYSVKLSDLASDIGRS